MNDHQRGPSAPLSELAFYASPTHDCGYLPERSAVTLFADPKAAMDPASYSALAELGFRRSGCHVYRPHCPQCQACVAARLPVADFQPNRTQRRTFNPAAAEPPLSTRVTGAEFRDEHFALYQKYIATRHAGGGMDDSNPERYVEFLTCDWAQTEFVEFRRQQRLVAVAVTDVLSHGLSSVYTFFDPELANLSLGRYALLWQIAETRRRGLPWLFLGYWIGHCQKMAYKQEYRPIELLLNGRWQRFDKGQTLPTP